MISDATKRWAAQALFKALGDEMKSCTSLPNEKNLTLLREATDLIQQLIKDE